MKKKNLISKVLVLALALVMVFTMTASAFATTNGTVTVNLYIVDPTTNTVAFTQTDSVSFTSGDTLYDLVESEYDYYEPLWDEGIDAYNTALTTQYLNTFIEMAPIHVDHMYSTTLTNWSKDWGWVYTVNGTMPTFSDNAQHRKAMNQYELQSGDSIDIAYTLTYTTWQPNSSDATMEILYAWK